MPRAFTRAVSPKLAKCELTHLHRVPIDVTKAVAQHALYERALLQAGLMIERLPELAACADAVFVEDTAILLGNHAVITRPGAASRMCEADSTAACLARSFEVHRIECGRIDGGDVIRIDRLLYVGASSRTDVEGIRALAELVRPLGYRIIPTKLRGGLHLKTGASYAGRDAAGTPVLIYDEQSVDPSQFADVDCVATAPGECSAANGARAGDRLILAARHPRTADKLRSRGFEIVEVDVSEFQKAEAGVTCMSLIDDQV